MRPLTIRMPRLVLAVLFAVVLVATGALAPATARAADNLVLNGDFNQGTSHWKTDSGYGKFSTRAIAGNQAMIVQTVTAGAAIVLNDRINTVKNGTKGITYSVSARVRSNLAGLSGQLRVREASSSGLVTHASTFFIDATDWATVRLTFTTTLSTADLDLNVLAWKVSTDREVIVDDVVMEVASSATTPPPAATESAAYTLSDGCSLNARGIGKCTPLVGAAHGSNGDPAALEKSMGQRFGVRRTFWGATQVASAVRTAEGDVAAGRIPWMSFKLPHSWADMASGKGDAWAKDLASRISGVKGPVWVAFHHEPEGDGDVTTWKKIQERLGPILRNGAKNVGFSVILTGWNQWYGESKYRIENIWPNTTVDIAGFDAYCFYGTWKNGKYRTGDPSLKVAYFDKISAWAKSKGVAWGLAETALTDAASADNPNWIKTTHGELKATGALAMAYFDTKLHSDDSYHLTGGQKNRDYQAALKASPMFPKS